MEGVTAILLELGAKEGMPELLSQVRVVSAQRGAAQGAAPVLDHIERALDETIEVITGKATANKGWWRTLIIKARQMGIAPDEVFKGQSMRAWLDDHAVRGALREITVRWLTVGSSEAEDEPDLVVLAGKYEEHLGDAGQLSRGAVDVVLGVLLAGMAAELKGGAGALAMMMQAMTDILLQRIDQLGAKLDEEAVATRVASIPSGAANPEMAARFFENSWPKLAERLEAAIKVAQFWVYSTRNRLEKEDELIHNSGEFSPYVTESDLKIIAYDRDFLRVALGYAQVLDKKEAARRAFNNQVRPITESFYVFAKTRGLCEALGVKVNEEKTEKDRANDMRIFEEVKRIYENYGVPTTEPMKTLREKVAYQADLHTYLEGLRMANDQLQAAINKMNEKIGFYDVLYKRES